jgi:hypothetical protein
MKRKYGMVWYYEEEGRGTRLFIIPADQNLQI